MGRSALLIVTVLALMLSGCGPQRVEYPAGSQPGSSASAASERTAVLDQVEAAVRDDIGQATTLEVRSVSIRPPFAAVVAVPRAESGDAIDFTAIPKYASAVNAGAFDDQVLALLKETAGGWEILEYELGSTDFPGRDWAKAHGAPEDMFGQ